MEGTMNGDGQYKESVKRHCIILEHAKEAAQEWLENGFWNGFEGGEQEALHAVYGPDGVEPHSADMDDIRYRLVNGMDSREEVFWRNIFREELYNAFIA
jgi:hypothetical protein